MDDRQGQRRLNFCHLAAIAIPRDVRFWH